MKLFTATAVLALMAGLAIADDFPPVSVHLKIGGVS